MITVRGPRALVKRLEAPKPASQSIIIPDSVVEKASPFAIVLAIGKLVQGGFEPGDTVLLQDYTGYPCVIDLDGTQIEGLIVPEDSVLAVVENM